MNKVLTKHGLIELPAFMPDATYGSIRAISFKDAEESGINEIVTTTLHIEEKIGSTYIKELGGINKFFKWNRPILTDSGGWQVFSLINNSKNNKNIISSLGCSFINPINGKSSLLTPESSQIIQNNIGSDIVTVLDNPILGDVSYSERKECVRINTNWAERSKKKFIEINNLVNMESFKFDSNYTVGEKRPLIGSVIQGGNDFELRKLSAQQLIELDFDMYNFGGMPLHTKETWRTESKKGFYHEMLHFVSELIPNNKIKYAMGVGQPEDIAYCVDFGWHMFDTVLPTRNARHGYIYVSQGQSKGEPTRSYKNLSYDILHLKAERYKLDQRPLDETCECICCKTVTRAYLRHLLRINELAGLRLATIHNLNFYSKWMKKLVVPTVNLTQLAK